MPPCANDRLESIPKAVDERSFSRCPVCTGRKVQIFFEIPEFPTLSNVLLKSSEAAQQWPKAPIRLGFCRECGWIGNTAFDAQLLNYDEQYENSLHYSGVFQNYAKRLALDLFRRHHLEQKNLIEIGCGQGDFLYALCRLGRNRGVGFDPGFRPDQVHRNGHYDVQFVRDYYSPNHAGYPCDFLCCRHVLEHIAEPVSFLRDVRKALENSAHAKLYFEVPNALFTLRGMGIWDAIYEHRSYFTRPALRRLFAASGFRVLNMQERFARQFLSLDAAVEPIAGSVRPSGSASQLRRLASDVSHFVSTYQEKTEKYRQFLRHAKRSGRRVVLWGAGAKAVNFLNVFRNEAGIEFVVDLNLLKQGMFIPGTGQQIVAPEFLRAYRPDAVVVMNPIYRREIATRLDALGLHAEVLLA